MYTEHFNLVKRPFSRVPSANGCVMYPGMKSCFDRAGEGIEECSGPVLIVGPSGSGKSTLLALLENRFSRELTVVTLNCAAIDSRQELIQCLLFELSLPFDSNNVGELRLKLIDHLKSPEQCPNGLLLLVDEAHNLPMDVLEELRMITNMVCGLQHQIRLVIAGGRPLEEKLSHPQLESFSQRIGVRCYLQNMSRTETMFFTLAQLQMCGRDGREIFQPSALEKIFDITDGVPRLVAHLSDHTLKMAAQNVRHQIDAKLVQQAWLDLQQLPAMPELEEFEDAAEGIIEFGSLDEAMQNSPDSLDNWPANDAPAIEQDETLAGFDSSVDKMIESDEKHEFHATIDEPVEAEQFESAAASQPAWDSQFEPQIETQAPREGTVEPMAETPLGPQAKDPAQPQREAPVPHHLDAHRQSQWETPADPHARESFEESAEYEGLPDSEFDRPNPTAPVQRIDEAECGVADATNAIGLEAPVESTLDALLQHLSDINSDTPAESNQEIVDEMPETVGSLDASTSEISGEEAGSIEQPVTIAAESQMAPQIEPELPPEPDPTMTQAFHFRELSIPENIVSPETVTPQIQTPDVEPEPQDRFDPTVTQAFPFRELTMGPDEDTPPTNAESPAEPPAVTAGTPEFDTSKSISTEELFGSAFEDEQVIDIQSSLLAEQNRISSSMTSPEVADLLSATPESPANATQSFDSVTISDEESASHQDSTPAAGPEQVIHQIQSTPASVALNQTPTAEPITQPLAAPPSVSEEVACDTAQPATAGPTDDSDMLIVEQNTTPEPPAEPAPSDQATSQGQVIRMNYQDLFQQLRNQNPNTQT